MPIVERIVNGAVIPFDTDLGGAVVQAGPPVIEKPIIEEPIIEESQPLSDDILPFVAEYEIDEAEHEGDT